MKRIISLVVVALVMAAMMLAMAMPALAISNEGASAIANHAEPAGAPVSVTCGVVPGSGCALNHPGPGGPP
jgi:hypothetical protein